MITTRRRAEPVLVAALLAGGVAAQDLSLPAGAEETFGFSRDSGAYDLPVGPWHPETGLPTRRVEGGVTIQAFRIDSVGLTPQQVLLPLRAQLQEAGFRVLLDCLAAACGGFDFRFATTVLPAPQMYVDLSDFHFLAMQDDSGAAVSVLASRDRTAGFVQIVRAGGGDGDIRTDAALPRGAPVGDIAHRLEADGHVVLPDLVFGTGASTLGSGAVASLDALAGYLRDFPDRRVLFVGHTDATGSLEANQAVSLRRAQAAVDYLRDRHDIPARQIDAQGAGYLAPIASNLTPEGRETNRRVEAVLLSTE